MGSITAGGQERVREKSCALTRTDACEFHVTMREIDEAYNVIQHLVADPRKNVKRISIAMANRIMECIEMIWRAFYRAELDNASLVGGTQCRGSSGTNADKGNLVTRKNPKMAAPMLRGLLLELVGKSASKPAQAGGTCG